MKILVVSSYLPHPLFSGGHVRLYNLLKYLSQKHEITLICEKRSNQTEDDTSEVKKFCNQVLTVDRRKQWSLGNILKTGFSTNPFLLVGHKSAKMKYLIQKTLSEQQFDVIHVETFYVMQNLPKTTLPVVLVEHNIEYLVYQRFTKNAALYVRPLLMVDVKKLKRIEENAWKKASKLVFVSEMEKRISKIQDAEIVPNGVDVEKFQPKADRPLDDKSQNDNKTILFIGDFKWVQNRDAVEWLLKDIWPSFAQPSQMLRPAGKASEGKPKLKLWIVGRKIPDSIRKLVDDENVIFDENAPKDTAEIFAKSDILLAPIRVGGGTSFKILEAMASGCVVVTTPIGIEGLEAQHNKEALIGESTSELVELTQKILEDEELYRTIQGNARELIEKKYSWDHIGEKLERVYESVV